VLPFQVSQSDWQLCVALWGSQACVKPINSGWSKPTSDNMLALAKLQQLQYQGILSLLPAQNSQQFMEVFWLGHVLVFEVGEVFETANWFQKAWPQLTNQLRCTTIRLELEKEFEMEEIEQNLRVQVETLSKNKANLGQKIYLRRHQIKKVNGTFLLLTLGNLRFFLYQYSL